VSQLLTTIFQLFFRRHHCLEHHKLIARTTTTQVCGKAYKYDLSPVARPETLYWPPETFAMVIIQWA